MFHVNEQQHALLISLGLQMFVGLLGGAMAYRLAVDAGGSLVLDIFPLICYFSLLSPSLELTQYTVQPVLSKHLRDNQNVIA